MVKADAKQDYYGDLGLPVSADHEEIKRHFRLLAKQYHPDRNSGHEVEVVAKFQAIQAAYEILSDPTEKRKYDIARAKHVRTAVPPPPKASDDPYNFRKPTRTQASPFPPPPPPPPQNKPKQRQYPQPQETPASAGATKFNAFTRTANNQTWDRTRFEDAARAEAVRGFASMRSGQQTPEMPPRPPRTHPTAPRPASSDMPNGPNPGFPGVARTSSARKNAYPDEVPYVPRSAYSHVRASRPPQAQQPSDHWNGPSPPKRPSGSPLRHTKSSEPTGQPPRPGLFERQQSRYASTAGEKTDINPGLSRSSSVRNSPIDPRWEEPDAGPFGTRPRSHPPPPRPRSANANVRTSTSTADLTSSDSSADEAVHMASRPKAQPRRPKVRVPTQDGMDTQASFQNYTRVVPEGVNDYVYPPPESKQPTRAPFPNVASPDDAPADRTRFRYALSRFSPYAPRINGLPAWAVPSSVHIIKTDFGSTSYSRPDPIFREANFQHEDWAEKLRNAGGSTSPSKKNTRPRGRTHPSNSPDQDVEMNDNVANPEGHTNGVGITNLEDLKSAGPFGTTGLHAMDDLNTTLPFESKAANDVKIPRDMKSLHLSIENLPKPPTTMQAPAPAELTQEKWEMYTKKMGQYLYDWKCFNHKMVAHFQAREDLVEESMNPGWWAIHGDGPKRNARPHQGGYDTYMQMLEDDRVCRAYWTRACDLHTQCMRDLGQVRQAMKGTADDSEIESRHSA